MRLDHLTEIFVKHVGARKDGGAYLLPAEAEASIFVALEGETLTIQKVSRIEPLDTLVTIDTTRGERFVVAAEDVRGVKVDKSESSRRERSAGFGK
jgi:hypothetical protein